MKLNQLYHKFIQGLKWNALFYALRKSMSTILTILLFKQLTTQDFSLWANIYSAIFLTLLWLDFGFRKSLPRYCPEFAKNKNFMKKFITYLVSFQTIVLIIFTPIFIKIAHMITHRLQITNKIEVFYLGCILFVTEGVISVIRLIYYSYFWQKQFNSKMSIIITFKTLILIFFILAKPKSNILLKIVFVTELLATFIAIIISLHMLKRLYKSQKHTSEKKTQKKSIRDFAFHSGIMWINNNLKSLSERNFMMLFFTHLLGPLQANLFKLANDGALFFQRIVVKTIGTTDTSLLSYIEIEKNNISQSTHEKDNFYQKKRKHMQEAFEQLIIKIASLCIPLFGILFFISFNFNYLFKNQFVFQIFFLVTTFYLFEYILSPYERLLEVKRRYILLFISYVPYIIIIAFLLFFQKASTFGLLEIIISIHLARLIISFVTLYFAKSRYRVQFPYKKVLKISYITIFFTTIASLIIKIFYFQF